uniref:hypothetical protein n=1 Tax=Methylogaea oryzae TaxID=1295382 RepID=UPI0006CF60C8
LRAAFAVRYRLTEEDKASPLLVSDRLRELVELLAREASTRGGQSGGFSIIVKKLDALSVIFDKAVKGKREDIVKVVCGKIVNLLKKAGREATPKPAISRRSCCTCAMPRAALPIGTTPSPTGTNTSTR